MQNIGGYVLDHTTRDAGRWNGLPADQRGPYFVSTLHVPRKGEFLALVRRQREKSPGCNPLDGREHSLGEMARWIGNTALAVRFIGLGVILGAFELTSAWQGRVGEDHEDEYRRTGRPDEVRFRLIGPRPPEATERAGVGPWARGGARRAGARRPRSTRRWPGRNYGIGRSAAM